MRGWGSLSLMVLFALCVGASALASGLPSTTKRNNLDSGEINQDPLRGLVINRTITTLGWDFYKSFSGVWQALHPNSQFTLTVTERPTAQFGSEIWITYHNTTLYHAFLSPARSHVNDTAKKAAQLVQGGIERIEQEEKVLNTDSDLAPSEY